MPRTTAAAKQVRDVKGPEVPAASAAASQAAEQKDNRIAVNPGNIPVLTVQLLDAINRNLIALVQQNTKIIKMLEQSNG